MVRDCPTWRDNARVSHISGPSSVGKTRNELVRVEGEVELVEVVGIFQWYQQGKVDSLNPKQGCMQLQKSKLLRHPGHVVSKEGAQPDPAKVKAILEWEPPKNVSKSFEELKKRLTSTPILGLRGWRICGYTDASRQELGCVWCSMKGYRLCFEQLRPHEMNYLTMIWNWQLYTCIENLEALPVWGDISNIYKSQKFEVYPNTERVEFEAKKEDNGSTASMICYNVEYLTAIIAMNVHFNVGENEDQGARREENQFIIQDDGMLLNGKRVCAPNVEELRTEIMQEAHYAPYAMHPGSTKMYRDLKPYYWWPKMKKDVAEFVADV
ncbi:UNVERIFIED_CONTAM: hypothetical protein Scaly_1628400 [Sesamum calycinum]|uniref:Integrase zinc-binding domain-containing protein n=1 Tax=Sesamum calycinum TaxID=2727403 RepID=A0AAW2P824_9LAMI